METTTEEFVIVKRETPAGHTVQIIKSRKITETVIGIRMPEQLPRRASHVVLSSGTAFVAPEGRNRNMSTVFAFNSMAIRGPFAATTPPEKITPNNTDPAFYFTGQPTDMSLVMTAQHPEIVFIYIITDHTIVTLYLFNRTTFQFYKPNITNTWSSCRVCIGDRMTAWLADTAIPDRGTFAQYISQSAFNNHLETEWNRQTMHQLWRFDYSTRWIPDFTHVPTVLPSEAIIDLCHDQHFLP